MEKNSDPSKYHFLTTLFWSFWFLAVGLGIAAFLLFYGIKLMIENDVIQDTLNIRTVLHINLGARGHAFWEIDEHPFPYLLTIVLVSSIIGGLWTARVASKHTQHFILQILALPWISVVATSVIWGIVFSKSFRGLQYLAENFPRNPIKWLLTETNAMNGLTWGWLSALQSFPINILSYLTFCFLLFASKKLFSTVVPKNAILLSDEKPA